MAGGQHHSFFVGYQAVGTPGRALLEGTQEIKLVGEPVHVAAKICRMPGISGHADVNGLVDWIKAFEVKPQKVFVTHGEDTVTELFAARLRDEMNYDAYAPFSGTEFDLAEGEFLYEAEGVKIQKPAALQKKHLKAAKVYEKVACAWIQTAFRHTQKRGLCKQRSGEVFKGCPIFM